MTTILITLMKNLILKGLVIFVAAALCRVLGFFLTARDKLSPTQE